MYSYTHNDHRNITSCVYVIKTMIHVEMDAIYYSLCR